MKRKAVAEEEEKQEEVQQPYQGRIIAPKDSAKDLSSLLFFVRRLCPPFFSYQDEAEHSRLHSLRPARHLQLYAPATPQNAQLCPLPPPRPPLHHPCYITLATALPPPTSTPLHSFLIPPHTPVSSTRLTCFLKCLIHPFFLGSYPKDLRGSLPSRSQPSSLSTEIVHFGRNHSDSTYVSPFTSYP